MIEPNVSEYAVDAPRRPGLANHFEHGSSRVSYTTGWDDGSRGIVVFRPASWHLFDLCVMIIVMRGRPKEITTTVFPVGLRWELSGSERDLLHPLFVELGNQAVFRVKTLEPLVVREAIERIADRLTSALCRLDPDAVMATTLEFLRRECHEYLDTTPPHQADWEKITQLRLTFAMVADATATNYRLPSAARLAASLGIPELLA